MSIFARSAWALPLHVVAFGTVVSLAGYAQKPLPIAPPSQQVESPAASSRDLAQLLDEIWQNQLKVSPEYATYLGDKRYDDQLSDVSPRAINDELARERGYIVRLSQIDTTHLSPQEQLSATLMLRQLVDLQEAAPFKEWEMPVTQYTGVQLDLPQLATHTQFDAAQDYDHYVTRLSKVPALFTQTISDMQLGIDDQRTVPGFLMEQALAQTKAIASMKPEDTPFAIPLKHFPATMSAAEQTRIRTAVLNAITMDVLPSYQRFAKFLETGYIPYCRKDPGVWAINDGDAYYAYKVHHETTLNLTAAQIHEIGLKEVARDEAEMLAIVKKLGYNDLQSFNAALKADPKEHPASAQALLAAYKGYIDQMRPKLPQLFGHLPKAKLEVVAMPDYMAPNQPQAFYDQGTPDGRRPGNVDVNLYHYADRSLADVEAIAYHEGIPGHHLQISIAQELTSLPEFRRQAQFTAYTEGWALYSERLGKEIGFYQDPYSDYGRLEADEWRAIRLVVDTGVHSQHWTRQQMVNYFHAHSTLDETNIQSEVDRYISWPAQALGYKMGQLKILELRDRAKAALGPKFDLRAFHDAVLDSGALPLDILEQQIDAWIKAQQATPAAR